jgi:hypothetical protein
MYKLKKTKILAGIKGKEKKKSSLSAWILNCKDKECLSANIAKIITVKLLIINEYRIASKPKKNTNPKIAVIKRFKQAYRIEINA